MKDLTVQSAPRRQNAQAPPTLESFEFIPYFDAQSLQNLPKIRQFLFEYANLCKSAARGEIQKEKGEKTGHLLKVLLKEEEKSLEKLSQDPLFGAVWLQDRALAPLLDIVLENLGNRLNFSSKSSEFVADRCKFLLNRNPMLNLNFAEEKSAKNLDFFVQEFPLSLENQNVGEFLEKIGKKLKSNGFILVPELTGYPESTGCSESTGYPEIVKILTGNEKNEKKLVHNRIVEEFSQGTGFQVVAFQTDPSFFTTLYLLKKIPEIPEMEKNENILEISKVDEFFWISEVKNRLLNSEKFPKPLWISTMNCPSENGLAGFANCLKAEFGLESVKILQNASLMPNMPPNGIALKRRMQLGLFANVYRDGEWGSFRHIPIEEGMFDV